MGERDELSGRGVGEFVLRDRIGEGGFGAVYRCEQPLLGREAVVKVLHHRLRDSELMVQRFLREARLASRLDHPYAAHVYAFGVERDDGLVWIAMEMVHGIALDRWLRERGPLPLDQLVPLFERVAEVVHTAHDRGIVHRDLKPSNIMVIERAGRLLPKLLDFGIAKLLLDEPAPPRPAGAGLTLSEDDGRPRDAGDTLADTAATPALRRPPIAGQLTRTDVTLGSPPYMSPEQWLDPVRVGPRSDLYALAIIAYEALAGRRPFQADTAADYADLHLEAPVPPLGDGGTPELDRFFARALAKRPDDRPASAIALAEDLRAASGLTAARAPSSPVAARARRPGWPALAAAGALLVAAAALAWPMVARDRAPGRGAGGSPPAMAPLALRARGAGAPVADTAPGDPPAPARIAIHIDSSPARADVYRLPSQIKVGVTPWDGELAAADGAAVFVLKKRGHHDARVEVDLRTGGWFRATLRPVAAAGPPAGRRKGEPADPFGGDAR